jgi:hypothetical protein
MAEIYGLYHPITGELRYIGKANDSLKRLKSHLRDSKTRNTPLYVWVRELIEIGIIPEFKVLIKTDDWQKSEIELIAFYRKSGANLLNIAIGGNEPFCSKEIRANNGRNNAEKIHSNPKSKRLWHLKKMLSHNLKFLLKIGRYEKIAEIKLRLSNNGISI